MIQFLIDALASAADIAPGAVAFTLIFVLFRYANFAAGAFVTLGAFVTWTLNVPLGLPLWLSGLVGLMIGALALVLSDRLVFHPLRGRSGATLLLVSVAFSFILENILRFFYGSDIRSFNLPLMRPLVFGGIRVPYESIWVISAAILSIAVTGAILGLTPIGRALRAVADNPGLANVRGLPVERVHIFGLLLAGALFGLNGTVIGLDLVIDPSLNWSLTVPIIAAAIFGGLGSPLGAALGALAIGATEELTVLFISPAYKAAVGFVVIAIILLLRPQGLLGIAVDRK